MFRQLQREPRLAAATDAGQCQDARIAEQARALGEFAFAADEMRPLARQVVAGQRFPAGAGVAVGPPDAAVASASANCTADRVPVLRALRQRALEHARDGRGHRGQSVIDRARCRRDVQPNQRLRARRLERRLSREHLEDDARERVDVRRRAHGLTARLLRAHVGRRSQDAAERRRRLRAVVLSSRGRARDAEVRRPSRCPQPSGCSRA